MDREAFQEVGEGDVRLYYNTDTIHLEIERDQYEEVKNNRHVKAANDHLEEVWASDIPALPIDSATDRMELVMQIINQNRLFERVAERNDADDLARVLRAFEPVLVRLAEEDLSDADAEALRAKLAFELNVMLTKLSRDSSNETDTAETGIQT